MSLLNPSLGIVLTNCTSLIKIIAILIENECFSKLEMCYTNLRDCINVKTLLFQKIIEQSMIDKKIDEKKP